MNRSEQNRLLGDVLAGDDPATVRQASLDRALDSLRRHRRRRLVMRVGGVMSLVLVLAWGMQFNRAPAPLGLHLGAPHSPVETAEVKVISDEELFELFPGRPLALIGKPGQQQFVFLDEPVDASDF